MNSVRESIFEAVQAVWSSTGQNPVEIKDGSRLTDDLQLNSLDLAQLVVQLEQSLKLDPFRAGAEPVRTFGELVELYENEVGK